MLDVDAVLRRWSERIRREGDPSAQPETKDTGPSIGERDDALW
jgi:hypothetical protein